MNLCGRIRFHENSILKIISAVLLISASSSVIAKGQSYQNTPFDLSTPTLPPGYLGYDPEAFVKTYQAVAAEEQQARQKSEFETTAAYEKRLKELGTQNTFTNNTHAFSAIPTSVSYNADAQTFTLQLKPKFASHNADYAAVLLESGAKDMGSYQAENGFGAQFTVGESSFFSYQVWFPMVQKPTSCAATITVPPTEAETM